MDVLAGLLDGPRARGAFVLRMVMDPPWSVRVEDGAPLCLMCVTRGEAWLVPGGPDQEGDPRPVLLRPGDVAIACGPDPYLAADRPTTPPDALIGPGGSCATLRGEPLEESMHLGLRTWGNAPEGATAMLIGTYQMDGEVGGRLLGTLPGLLHLTADAWNTPLTAVLEEETSRD